MSKYEQISNWSHRPLRKSQIHYAAMDAFILLKIYDTMIKNLAEQVFYSSLLPVVSLS